MATETESKGGGRWRDREREMEHVRNGQSERGGEDGAMTGL